MLFRFNRLTLLANIVSLQFTEMSKYQPSLSYRASKSRFFPYIHCKFWRVCPTTKMTSATVKPSIANTALIITRELITDIFAKFFLSSYISLHEFTAILTALRMLGCHLVPDFWQCLKRIYSNLKSAGRLIVDVYYTNISEVPGELSRVNMICSQ